MATMALNPSMMAPIGLKSSTLPISDFTSSRFLPPVGFGFDLPAKLPPLAAYREMPWTRGGDVFDPEAAYRPSWRPSVMDLHDSLVGYFADLYMRPATNAMLSATFRPTNWVELDSLANPIRVMDRDGSRMLFLAYDMRGFKPEEISVTWNKAERAVIVEAALDSKQDVKEHHVMRRYWRKFVLPESLRHIDLSKVSLRAAIHPFGLLTIEGVLPRMSPEEWSKVLHSHTFSVPFGGVSCSPIA